MLPIPFAYQLIAVAVLCIGAFMAGIKVEADHRDAQDKAAIQSMHDRYVEEVRRNRGIAQDTAKELLDAKMYRDQNASDYRKALRENTRPLMACPPSGPVLTPDFVRLYDRALQAGVPAPGDPQRADDPAPGTDPVIALAVHGENAESWAACRDHLKGWQALARRYGWAK